MKDKIEKEIEEYLSDHKGLSSLQEERKRKLKSDKLDNSKPLKAVLSQVFKHSSALSKIFLKGERLSNPFKTMVVSTKDEKFKGKQYPIYFKFRKINYGETFIKEAFLNSKCRISFETDADNGYFNRKSNPGRYNLFLINPKTDSLEAIEKQFNYSMNLFEGSANLSIELNDNLVDNRYNRDLSF